MRYYLHKLSSSQLLLARGNGRERERWKEIDHSDEKHGYCMHTARAAAGKMEKGNNLPLELDGMSGLELIR